MHPYRQAIYPKSVICEGLLIVVKLKGCKVGMLLKADENNLSTLQLYNF
jgi:hypothetical protein